MEESRQSISQTATSPVSRVTAAWQSPSQPASQSRAEKVDTMKAMLTEQWLSGQLGQQLLKGELTNRVKKILPIDKGDDKTELWTWIKAINRALGFEEGMTPPGIPEEQCKPGIKMPKRDDPEAGGGRRTDKSKVRSDAKAARSCNPHNTEDVRADAFRISVHTTNKANRSKTSAESKNHHKKEAKGSDGDIQWCSTKNGKHGAAHFDSKHSHANTYTRRMGEEHEPVGPYDNGNSSSNSTACTVCTKHRGVQHRIVAAITQAQPVAITKRDKGHREKSATCDSTGTSNGSRHKADI
jgi:hypothetical protein